MDTVKVVRKSVPDLIEAPGSVEPIDSVAVKSLVDGQLLDVRVKDGDEVKKGELLFKIDPRPAQAALAQVQAALAKDVAARDLSKAQLDRYEPVASKGFISADQMQQYRTAYAAAAASVKVDQANVEATKLTLGYTDIFAPLAGRAGRILVQAGNLVKANDTQPLLTINQVSPIYVSFAIPGAYVDRVRNAQAKGKLPVFASGEGLDGHIDGELAFVDNAVDPSDQYGETAREFHERRRTPVAGRVRQHHAHARHRHQCAGRARLGGESGAERQLRVRHRQRQQGAAARGESRAHRQRRQR